MISSSAARVAARRLAQPVSRGLHSTPVANGGKYDYLHAKYMYNLRNQPANPVKAGALIGLGVVAGVGIPIFAVDFNQRKAGLK